MDSVSGGGRGPRGFNDFNDFNDALDPLTACEWNVSSWNGLAWDDSRSNGIEWDGTGLDAMGFNKDTPRAMKYDAILPTCIPDQCPIQESAVDLVVPIKGLAEHDLIAYKAASQTQRLVWVESLGLHVHRPLEWKQCYQLD